MSKLSLKVSIRLLGERFRQLVRLLRGRPRLTANWPPIPLVLFDGKGELFLKVAKDAITYGEYGAGISTVWMFRETSASIYSIDSSKEWAEKVTNACQDPRVIVDYIDIGELEEFGTPKNYEKRENFRQYVTGIWQKDALFDLVLIDGRFRVACFIECLKRGSPGMKILFDDYPMRGRYHIVEEFLKPTLVDSKQALFILPASPAFSKEVLDSLQERFLMVVD